MKRSFQTNVDSIRLHSGAFRLPDKVHLQLVARWRRARLVAATLSAAVAVPVAMVTGGATGRLTLGLAAALVLDAVRVHRTSGVAWSIVLDAVLTTTASLVLDITPTALGLACTYFVTASLILGRRSSLAAILGVTLYVAGGLEAPGSLMPPPDSVSMVVGYGAGAVFVVATIALVGAVVGLLSEGLAEREAACAELEHVIASKDEFVASVSHELRTPLTAVVGLTTELHHGWDEFGETERREFLAIVAEEAAEVADIIDDLLVAARSDIGTLAVRSEPMDLVGVALHAVTRTPVSATVVTVGPNRAQVRGDSLRVRQIIRNLLTNAARYGGQSVWIEVTAGTDEVRLAVHDDGPGVPEEHEDRIFDAYHRAHAPGTQPGSVGLGLHVARQLARAMGGDLVYARRAGVTTFALTLPVAVTAAAASA